MDWVLLSFAVISPMSASIGMAFTRRDQALVHLAAVKTTLWNIYSAHACWDWPTPKSVGRSACEYDWRDHGDQVVTTIVFLCQDLSRLLTLPSSSRARHRVTDFGNDEAQKINAVRVALHQSLYRRVATLTKLCENFKRQGLPPNEATRVRQWERMVTERIGTCSMIWKRSGVEKKAVVFTFRLLDLTRVLAANRTVGNDQKVPDTASITKFCETV